MPTTVTVCSCASPVGHRPEGPSTSQPAAVAAPLSGFDPVAEEATETRTRGPKLHETVGRDGDFLAVDLDGALALSTYPEKVTHPIRL